MAMPKLFGQVLEKLDGLGTVIAMLQRVEAKVDKLLAALETETPAATTKPIMQVDETTAVKMEKSGDFAPAKGKK
jgi:hypothetical protein